MSYEKTIWQSGDLISVAKLNKIEDGIAAAAQGQDTESIVVFNLDNIIDEAQSENGFSLSTFTDAIEQGKIICILKRANANNDYSSLQDSVYFLASSGSYDSTISFVFEKSKIFLGNLDKNLTYARLFFIFNEDQQLLTQINSSQYLYNLSTATGEATSDTIWPVSTDPIES